MAAELQPDSADPGVHHFMFQEAGEIQVSLVYYNHSEEKAWENVFSQKVFALVLI